MLGGLRKIAYLCNNIHDYIMGTYINTGNAGFRSVRNSEFVDKSGLISVVNSTLFTERSFSCVTRCRRFGKSMAAKMLCAYYDHSCDSRTLFADLKIASDPSFEKHLNKYPVIYLDLSEFMNDLKDEHIVDTIQRVLKKDICAAYPDVQVDDTANLMNTLLNISTQTGQHFVFIIDEWDAICREYEPGTSTMDDYISWLRSMFKGANASRVFACVYMTGILPVKKYKTQSALNNFVEYSMVSPKLMSGYFGFTKTEVKALAEKYGMNFDELEKWYDGYQLGAEQSIFNPNSVMLALSSAYCESYWGTTGSFDAMSDYIQMNYEGLKDDIIRMLAGERCFVDPTGFQNDLSDIRSKDDVLTVLIHLGYLSYDRNTQECYIPNKEVGGEMVNAVKKNKWQAVASALDQSRLLLQATLDGDEECVAKGIDATHDENTSILSYNNENSLACVLSIAYYYAKNDYIFHRELPTGKGFADIVLIPRKNVDLPAIVLELKCNEDADTAIDQILRRQYPAKVQEYADRLLLVGVNYDKDTKTHTCRIVRT
jgi:hypothetical protein